MAKTAFGEEEDPTSRYQNPRYSGKGVPDRGNDPKRKRNQFSSAEYAKLRKGKMLDSTAVDFGVSHDYMEQLEKKLRKRP